MEKPCSTNRSRDYYRKQRKKAIRHKINIATFAWGGEEEVLNKPHVVGQLSKGKVHCSCPMCAEKTHIHGFKKSEKAVLDGMEQQLKDYEESAV